MELSISQEQNALIEDFEKNHMPQFLQDKIFVPRLLWHNGDNLEQEFLDLEEEGALYAHAEQLIKAQFPLLAYLIAYDSEIEINDEVYDAVIVETGDEQSELAYQFAFVYHLEENRVQEKQVLQSVPNLLA